VQCIRYILSSGKLEVDKAKITEFVFLNQVSTYHSRFEMLFPKILTFYTKKSSQLSQGARP